MGCYNVSCGVSRLSIGVGTKTVLIPLQAAEKYDGCMSDGACIVSNEGPRAHYFPFTLPIFGDYSDYGTLENIEIDCNTKSIEKYYNCRIDQFADYICRPFDGKNNDKFPKNPYGMFVNRQVYDKLANTPVSESGKMETAYNSSQMDAYMLKFLGFNEGNVDGSRKRYQRSFTHSDIPNLTVWSDNNWVEVYFNEKVFPCIYTPMDFYKFLSKNNLKIPKQITSLKKLRTVDIQFDKDIINKFVKAMELKKSLKNLDKTSPQYEAIKAMIDLVIGNHSIFNLTTEFNDNSNFVELYQEVASSTEFKKIITDYKAFEHMLWAIGTLLQPALTGPQCGNYHATKMLGKLIERISSATIESHKE